MAVSDDARSLLIAKIRAGDRDEPGDDTNRLVFADWLEQHGDLPRAMLIRLQCDVARLATSAPDDPRALAAAWEVDALLAAHGARWRAELPALPGVRWTRFERGFVTGARVATFEELHAQHAAIIAAAPIAQLALDSFVETHELPLPWLRELVVPERSYYLDDDREDPAPLARLAGSLVAQARALEQAVDENDRLAWLANRAPHAPLERLTLTGSHVAAAAAVAALANLPGAQGLRALDLGTRFVDHDTGYYDDPTLRADGAQALAALHLPRLERLDVSRQRVTGDGLAALLAALPALRELGARGADVDSLAFLDVGDAGDAGAAAPLRALDLGDNAFGARGALELIRAERCAQLEVLALDTCELTPNAVAAITHAPCWQTLRVLDLSRNPLGAYGALALAEAARPAQLHTLRIASCDFDGDAPTVLASIDWLRDLLVLDVGDNDLAAADALWAELAGGAVKDLAAANTKLTPAAIERLAPVAARAVRLDLGRNPGIGGALARWTHAPELQRLALAECGLGGGELATIFDGAAPRLSRLVLAGNPLAASHIAALARGELATRLAGLDLSYCLDAAGVTTLVAGAPRAGWRALDALDLRGPELAAPAVLTLARALPDVRVGLSTANAWQWPQDVRDELAALWGARWWSERADADNTGHWLGI